MNASKLIFQTLSPLVSGRVYPVIVPESQSKTIAGQSYIVYTLVSSNPENSNDGFEGHEYALMQIDVYSPSYSDTDVLMLQVINALNNIKAEIFLSRLCGGEYIDAVLSVMGAFLSRLCGGE